MMRIPFSPAGAFVLALAASCTPAPPDPGESPLETLQAREASFLAAVSARDAEGVAAHFSPDGVLHVGNMPVVRGQDAIREFYGNLFRFMLASEPGPETARVSQAGDLGYTVGRVVNAFPSGDGPVEFEGKYLIVWERGDEGWAVAVYAVSSDAP